MAFKMKKFGEITVDRAPLDSGVVAEARNDGTIVIDEDANLSPKEEERVIKHEMKHMQDMESGKIHKVNTSQIANFDLEEKCREIRPQTWR